MGRFSYVTSSWLETASEDELRDTASEMEALLVELDYDSDEHTEIYGIHIDVVSLNYNSKFATSGNSIGAK